MIIAFYGHTYYVKTDANLNITHVLRFGTADRKIIDAIPIERIEMAMVPANQYGDEWVVDQLQSHVIANS